MRARRRVTCLLVLLAVASAAQGAVVVRFEPPDSTVQPNEQFSITIVADVGEPVVGWGLDLAFDNAVLDQVGQPALADPWFSIFSPDGDGLAGLARAGSISGMAIPLAAVTFTARAPGQADLILSITPGDETEGFALFPTGSASTTFIHGRVTVVPEPSVCVFLALGFVGLLQRRLDR